MVLVLPEGKQGPVTTDLTRSRQMKQKFLIASALLNNLPLLHQDSRMAAVRELASSLTYSCYK